MIRTRYTVKHNLGENWALVDASFTDILSPNSDTLYCNTNLQRDSFGVRYRFFDAILY